MLKSNRNILVGFLVTAVWAGAASAAVVHTSHTIDIKINNATKRVTFQVAANEMVEYANDENCGNNAHKTSQNRWPGHIHITYSLDITGVDQNGNPQTITADKINNFWDASYTAANGYTRESGSSTAKIRYNCWAYAFGVTDAWVQDPDYVYADDYTETTKYEEAKLWAIGEKHVRVITASCVGGIDATKEKNQESGVYKKTWTPSKTTSDTLYKPN